MLNQASSRQRRTPKRSARLALAVACAALGALAACSDTTLPETIRVLDRPSAIAFSCYGKMVMADSGEVVDSPQPVSSCAGWRANQRPAGQEFLESGDAPLLIQFVLQSTQGSIAISQLRTLPPDPNAPSLPQPPPQFRDPDGATPGLNSIPVGTLPVDIATDPTGCHVYTANAGSCDLSILDVESAVNPLLRPVVSRLSVSNAAGERIGARPRAMAGAPGPAEVGVECADAPDSLVYIAYPDCNMVTAVSTATGEVVAGVVFRDDGTMEITDGNVGCAGTCGSPVTSPGGGPAAAAARPSVLHLDDQARRLYIGAENLAALVIVDLDEAYLPVAASSVPLEGDVGILSMDVSALVSYLLVGAPYRFAYAVATDGTVRVIEVERAYAECDTQVDTRYLHDVVDRTFLPCMPVGDPRTPPRRTGARSPGIHLSGASQPLDVAFVALDNVPAAQMSDPPAPLLLKGYFAYLTTTFGRVALVNISDERRDALEPWVRDVALALPHQIRDFGSSRDDSWETCDTPAVDQGQVAAHMPRIEYEPTYLFSTESVAASKRHLLPSMHRVLCEETDEDGNVTLLASVPELSIAAPAEIRDYTFPDFLAVAPQENWDLAWEGAVSLDSASTAVDGPVVRSGFFDDAAPGEFGEGGGPFCKMGAEPYDILSIVGCDPARGDAGCGLNEKCVGTGVCMPADRVIELSDTCSDYLSTRRRYTIREVRKDRLVLGERRRVLHTTPLTGCIDAEQCIGLYDRERVLASSQHPINLELEPSPYTWACEPDPSRAPGPPRCVMTCAPSAEDPRGGCEDGYACSSGRCVEGVLPPAQCVEAAQRYQVRVGDAFALIGSRTGFLHNRIVDPADPVSGACIENPEPNPLAVGRVPLNAPPCEGLDITQPTPNPCKASVVQVEPYMEWDTSAGTCAETEVIGISRPTPAIRVHNPVFTFHLIDPETSGDAQCNGDRLGTYDPHPSITEGYRMTFRVVGGHLPGILSMLPSNGARRLSYPIAIERGPYGDMWILDEGDRSSSIRGQMLWFRSEAPTELTTLNYLQ